VRKGKRHLEVCQKIMEKAKENNPDKDGVTPMHLAAQKGCVGIYKLILQNVEEKNPEDNQGKTPIEWAGGHTQILRAYSQFS
jgi:ankyrin repeat protein